MLDQTVKSSFPLPFLRGKKLLIQITLSPSPIEWKRAYFTVKSKGWILQLETQFPIFSQYDSKQVYFFRLKILKIGVLIGIHKISIIFLDNINYRTTKDTF